MNEQVLFEKKETYIHETANREETNNNGLSEIVKIGGRLQVVKNKFGIFIRFMPYGVDSNNVSDDWAFVVNNSVLTYNKDSGNNENESVTVENKTNLNKYKLQFELNELSAVRRIYQGYDIPSLVFMLSDGRVWPKIYFYKGGSKEFLQELKAYFIFTKNPNDPRLWSVQMQNGEKFQQSLNELKLFNEQRDTVMKKFLNEPLQSTFLGLSRVTNMVRDVLRPNENMAAGGQAPQAKFSPSSFEQAMKKYGSKGKEDVDGENKPSSSTATNNRHHDDLMADLMDSLTLDNIHSTINDGYEMVTKVDLGPMPEVCRGLPVDRTAVKYDKDGRLIDVDVLKAMIFRGGIEHELRKEVWKFMLNYYTWDSTEKWRIDRRKQRVDDYFRMKLQWKTMSDEQKSKFSTMKERENLIEKDVQRTDRTNSYFEGEHNPNLNAMKDILMTYNMYNFDLGYVQGMSDLLAPIMVIMDNEVDSFWCFAGFMDRVESNFLMDQLNIKLQLSNLKALLEFVDSKFSDYMERNDSANMYFCFRWILILFKREFNFPDVMTLWEVLWTDLPCKNFHLLICISILLMKKDDIIGNNYGFNEILKYINDLSFRIDLDKALENAEGLYLQIKNFKNLPSNICEILGFPVVEKNKEAEEFDETLGAIAAKATPRDQSPAASSIRMTPSKSSSSSLTASAATSSSSAIPKNKSYTFRKDEDSIELLN